MAKPIERKIYTDKIKGFFDTEQIKVITGIRRSGKSEILKLLRGEAQKVIDDAHIIFMNFEEAEFDNIKTYKELNAYIAERIVDDKKYYVFLDEVHLVENWEKAVNATRLKNTDIYITGSNSKMLSSELATLLSGRCLTFNVNTLSFAEFIRFREAFGLETDPRSDILDEYLEIGGFPVLSTTKFTREQCRQTVGDIHSSVILKDVVARNKVKNVPLLEKIIAFLYDNVGGLVSLRKIADYLKSNGGSGDFETISSYVGFLESACVLRKAPRYEIKGKKLLESNDKYYLADHSLQYVIRELRRTNLSGVLENVVYNDLIRRGYRVYVGKMGKDDNREIDFVAEKSDGEERVYIQVCYEFTDEDVLKREFTPLTEIKDHFPKYVVTLDKYWKETRNGVPGIHLKDFLLKDSL